MGCVDLSPTTDVFFGAPLCCDRSSAVLGGFSTEIGSNATVSLFSQSILLNSGGHNDS